MPLPPGLIVSCQAEPGSPFAGVAFIQAFAQAAVVGGAGAVRLCGVRNVQAVRPLVSVPIIGLTKHQYPDGRVLITESRREVVDLVTSGADVIAVDATTRRRPEGITGTEFVRQLKQEFPDLLVMADVDTLAAGVKAAAAGADYVATTLAGYTPETEFFGNDAPDFDLIRQLAQAVTVPIIAEGRIRTPIQARQALEAGACGVVVGSAITRPVDITRWFVQALGSKS
ncbi:bifunctional enzyme NanE/nanK [Gloeomargarita lithophora Alchichica-D10]|uniref:Putative N-acetylmannosamine-6-phosphate 2-epimerase n=1 Tax=Gloeomargarita lithophora Alchichica-D10 TaxID=1188229 RepID=A0A1J0ACC9_9CYAN|nr:putative N-acetylmannosamine-6-phosphate 2-epimerase [Gloeomargarita lithophora]APB33586.1 bifunctional enzyme NanE/nanK [Gloeomargarita lithophora Alchichica-D10]